MQDASVDELTEPLWRFSDLKRLKIADSHAQLRTLIKEHGFDPGFWLSPNIHVWVPAKVRQWLRERPTDQPPQVRERAQRSIEARRRLA